MVAAGSILAAAGEAALDWRIVAAMLTGGVIAAPVAAWSVRHLPARPMGVAVAALLLLTNARELGKWAELGWSTWLVYGAIVVLVALAALRPRLGTVVTEPGSDRAE